MSQIVDKTKHVLRVSTLANDQGRPTVQLVGWREASTFPGFCATHDSELFAPIEREQFTGSAQQTFLVGYRVLCHEIFAKRSAAIRLAKLLDVIDRGRSEEAQRGIQRHVGTYRAGVLLGHHDNSWYKQQADEILRSRAHSRWGGAIFEIGGRLSLASAGSATPSFDLRGNEIQNLGEVSRLVEPVMFGMVPGSEGGRSNFVVFSWPPACPGIEALMASLGSLSRDQIGDALARFMLAHVENTFFSVDWWSSLSALQRAEVLRLSELIRPEDEKMILGRPTLVDWQVDNMHVRQAEPSGT